MKRTVLIIARLQHWSDDEMTMAVVDGSDYRSRCEVDSDEGIDVIAVPIGSLIVFTDDGKHYVALSPVVIGSSGQNNG